MHEKMWNTVRGLSYISSELRLKYCMSFIIEYRIILVQAARNHSSCVHFGVVRIILKHMQSNGVCNGFQWPHIHMLPLSMASKTIWGFRHTGLKLNCWDNIMHQVIFVYKIFYGVIKGITRNYYNICKILTEC